MDELSDVLDVLEAHGQVSGVFVERGSWVARTRGPSTGKLMIVVQGRAELRGEGLEVPVHLGPGDVAVLNTRTPVELRGGSGDEPAREVEPEADGAAEALATADADCDVVVGGRMLLSAAGEALLAQALPPVARLRGAVSGATELQGTIDMLVDEMTRPRPGSAMAVRHYSQLLVLEVFRAYLAQATLPPGRLRVLSDERLRPAVTCMHTQPGRSWRLGELAGASAMSRTSFAERFRAVAGVPPLTYLAGWRMVLAQRALRHEDVPVGTLATRLGYASESAFSTAFKRETGDSPLRYRRRHRSSPVPA